MTPDDQRRATAEQTELTKEICELTRRIRWRVDQEMVRKNVEPIFKEHYYSYTKREFMLDADFEFYKVRNLLSKSPRLLQDDPVLSVDYMKVINLIKEKKLLESTSDHFDPRSSVQNHFHDIAKAEALQDMKRVRALEAAAMSAEIQSAPTKDVQDYDASLETKVKDDKKSK